jgi:hypothetical protein
MKIMVENEIFSYQLFKLLELTYEYLNVFSPAILTLTTTGTKNCHIFESQTGQYGFTNELI